MKSQVKKSVLELCKNNPQLSAFVRQTFLRNPQKDIFLNDVSDWNWDFEIGEFSSLFYLRNEDMLEFDEELPLEERGWQQETLEMFFEEYALYDNDELEKVILDNGKVLFLLDQDDYLEFVILDEEKIVGGYALL
jgi:hypothetical protein